MLLHVSFDHTNASICISKFIIKIINYDSNNLMLTFGEVQNLYNTYKTVKEV